MSHTKAKQAPEVQTVTGDRWPVAGGQFKNSNGMKVGGFVHLDETDSTGHSVGTKSAFQWSCAAMRSDLKPKLACKGQKWWTSERHFSNLSVRDMFVSAEPPCFHLGPSCSCLGYRAAA